MSHSESPMDVEEEAPREKMDEGSELTVAAALTSLVETPKAAESQDKSQTFTIPQRFTKSGRERAVPFPIKLMKVLSDKELSGIITWMPSGKSFSIVNPKTFVAEVLPTHFKSAKYSSFTRKLHRWGFMRYYRGEEAGAFYHKLFQKGRLDLVEKMTCKSGPSPKPPTPGDHKLSAGLARQSHRPVSTPPTTRPALPVPVLRPVPPTSRIPQLPQRSPILAAARPSYGSADRLNAAIELEVNRRLKERIAAASLSRQALAMMQESSGLGALGWSGRALNPATASLLLKGQLADPRYLAFPQTPQEGNIQGAKTA